MKMISYLCLAGFLGGLNILVSFAFGKQPVSEPIRDIVVFFAVGLIVQGVGGNFLYKRKEWSPWIILTAQIALICLPTLFIAHFFSPAWFILLPAEIWFFFVRPASKNWFETTERTI